MTHIESGQVIRFKNFCFTLYHLMIKGRTYEEVFKKEQKKTQAIKPGFIFGELKDYLSSPTRSIVESIYESMADLKSSKETS